MKEKKEEYVEICGGEVVEDLKSYLDREEKKK